MVMTQDESADGIRRSLRSPREVLGGFPILPRLIDKIRLHAAGRLPPAYVANLMKPPPFLDGRFLDFVGIPARELEEVVLSSNDDENILDWIRRRGIPRSSGEIGEWRFSIEHAPVAPDRLAHRIRSYPEVAARFDVGRMSPFDLIDLDEGRILVPAGRG